MERRTWRTNQHTPWSILILQQQGFGPASYLKEDIQQYATRITGWNIGYDVSSVCLLPIDDHIVSNRSGSQLKSNHTVESVEGGS
jgi:hypothetical protein